MASGVTRRGWGPGEAMPKEREAETDPLRSVATPQNGPREGHALNLLKASQPLEGFSNCSFDWIPHPARTLR